MIFCENSLGFSRVDNCGCTERQYTRTAETVGTGLPIFILTAPKIHVVYSFFADHRILATPFEMLARHLRVLGSDM